ncbi:hypothetical protein [uncultured Rummeliibacillus sp.]|uniref:hypothetical protein n=1 Tax=uncultured Rummeliibacillus sp. TaxID=762292 RepID=UPI00261EE268|nr:hypothetical protein [uncultured Rummeliibacillus sp.]
MSRTYSALLKGLLVGLTVGIFGFILETLGVQSGLVKVIVFWIAIYVVLKTFEKYKIYKTNSINDPE